MFKLKKWEISLFIAFIAALLVGGIASAQPSLNDKLLRLHVIAASDEPDEQALKLEVRDAVLDLLAQPLSGAADSREAEITVDAMLPQIEEGIISFLNERGTPREISVRLEECAFPTKDYGAFALPAGTYRALRVIIGKGDGQNWWCVVFPPLCSATAVKEVERASLAGGLSEDEARLITRDGGQYVIRFKFMEWLGSIKNMLWG